jgi:hypothetical protein
VVRKADSFRGVQNLNTHDAIAFREVEDDIRVNAPVDD